MTDTRDGKKYKTVKIASQTWMAENLNYEVKNSYCYNNFADSCAKYGHLYTWAAAVGKSEEECGSGKNCGLTGTVRGVCPEGWHVPTSTEWSSLYSAIGSSPYAMQAKGYWGYRSASKDTYGFSALPAGYYYNDRFYFVGSIANFWTATEGNSSNANYWHLLASVANLLNYDGGDPKSYGFAVRCVKD